MGLNDTKFDCPGSGNNKTEFTRKSYHVLVNRSYTTRGPLVEEHCVMPLLQGNVLCKVLKLLDAVSFSSDLTAIPK